LIVRVSILHRQHLLEILITLSDLIQVGFIFCGVEDVRERIR
jgi:hypothetical protein